MAEEILKIMPDLIAYDDEMTVNLLQMLSTTEILERKKGVCQHFANVYAALARGLGIPTRIVRGFNFDDGSMVQHAWVEIKIKENQWLPIEPQAHELRDSFEAYIPMHVASLYEALDFDSENYADLYSEGAAKARIGVELVSDKLQLINLPSSYPSKA